MLSGANSFVYAQRATVMDSHVCFYLSEKESLGWGLRLAFRVGKE